MRPGNGGNLGNSGNVESVSCRPHYPGDGTNPALCGWPVRYLKKIENRHDRGRMKAALPVILRPHPNQTANATGDPVDRKLGEYAMRQASCHDRMTTVKATRFAVHVRAFCNACGYFSELQDYNRVPAACLHDAFLPFLGTVSV